MSHPNERSYRRLSACAAAAVVAIAPAVVRADESNSNFRPYLIGSRAAGMGGAFTALADDGSGPYYNPAGIGFVRRSQLSLSGSVYGVASGTIQNALGDGHDFKFSSLQTLPTATAGVFRLGEDRDGDAHVLALTIYVPDAVNIDARDTINAPGNAFILTQQSQMVWAGATYARRVGRFSWGVSAFLLFGTAVDQFDLSALAPNAAIACTAGATCATRFATITSREDMTQYGIIGAAGVRWDPTDSLHLGLSVYSPALGFGDRKMFIRATTDSTSAGTGAAAIVVNAQDLHATPTIPLRAQAGVAWTSGRLTLAADVTFLAPRDVRDDAGNTLERHVVRNAVVNGAAGFEYVLADRFPLRAGVFTDFTSTNAPVGTLANGTSPDATNTSHVDRFGGSLSIGVRTEHTSTDLGFMISGGSGTDVIPNNLDFTQLKPTGSSQLFTYFFLGTAYQF